MGFHGAPPPEPPRNDNGAHAGEPAPHDLEAEESLLGAILLTPDPTITNVRELVNPGDFYYEKHTLIYEAAVALHDRGAGVDHVTVTDQLDRDGKLADAGGKAHVAELRAAVPSTANAPTYARRVHEAALQRAIINAGERITGIGWERPAQGDRLLELVEAAVDPVRLRARPTAEIELELGVDRATPGGSFALDEPSDIPAAWGTGHQVIWAEGEALLLVGPDGVGKTALQQQLLLARTGLRPGLLGHNVAPANGRILYIAADRPRQAARSLRRMVVPEDREHLDQHVTVWRGPLPFDPVQNPSKLAAFCHAHHATELYIDALKDIALDLNKDETGSRINRAFQECIAAGIELCISHHQRKEQTIAGKPTRLADVYGSRWITAGMGSVLLLWGEAGDPVIEVTHLKQPAEDVGPFRIIHDHQRGSSSVFHPIDLEKLIANTPGGVSARDAACTIFATETPSPNQVEKARRRLEALVAKGTLNRSESTAGTTYRERTK